MSAIYDRNSAIKPGPDYQIRHTERDQTLLYMTAVHDFQG